MSRFADPQSTLPRLRTPATGIVAVIAAGVLGTGISVLVHNTAAATLTLLSATVLLGGIIILHVRTRQRQAVVDLYLLRLIPMLGWPQPGRDYVVASRWRGGWVGHPTRIRIIYNPLADESLIELVAEARRLAEKSHGVPYKTQPQSRRDKTAHRFVLTETDPTGPDPHDGQIVKATSLVMQALGATAQVSTKFNNNDELHEINATYEPSLRLSSPSLRARVESSLSAQLPGRWRAFWDLVHDTVKFEVRPNLSSFIPNPNIAPAEIDPRATYDKLEVPIGLDEDGNVISWRPKRDPHGLVTGKTGKGKTVVLLGIIMVLAAHGWKIWGIDGKRIELLGLRDWPNVELIAGRIDHQARVAHEVYQMMQQRFADYEAGRVKLEDFEPVLFVIDEYKTFRNAVTRWYRSVKPKGATTQVPVLEEISDFVSLARKVRMHLVIGLQRPDAEFLTGDMRDNFNFRVSLGRLSPEGAKMMWDSYSTGVAIPPFAIGRGIAHNTVGAPVEIQTYWTPDPYQTNPETPELWVNPDDLSIVDQLRPAETVNELKEIIDPDEPVDYESDKPTQLDYNDYMEARIVRAGEASKLQRRASGILAGPENMPTSRDAELTKIQREEEEPELSDAEEMFAGYADPTPLPVEELLDEGGELATEGMLILVGPDTNTWGLVDLAEHDPVEDGYISISYRDYETGEPNALQLPADDQILARTPAGSEGH